MIPLFPFQKTILSLFDYSGNWSKPYEDAGYNVIRVDKKRGLDVRLVQYMGSRGAGEQGSRGAGEQGSRGAGEQGSRGAGEQGSRGGVSYMESLPRLRARTFRAAGRSIGPRKTGTDGPYSVSP